MASRVKPWWPALALAILLGAGGCSGILQESRTEGGQTERLRIQGSEGWKTYDRNPTKGDEGGFILKKEATF